jgi:acetyl-CoA carboxylase biotin carboxyl carrier protein
MSTIQSPVSGSVLRLEVQTGDKVVAGQTLAIVESMKMEIPVEAESAGTVTALHVQTGDHVDEDAAIADIA